jgi:hypothetical protein
MKNVMQQRVLKGPGKDISNNRCGATRTARGAGVGCCRESGYATAKKVLVGAARGPRAIHETAGADVMVIDIDMIRLLSW